MARTTRSAGRIAVAALIGCGISAWALPAACLSWARLTYARGQGAESCPDEAALRAAIAARLGYEPFLPAADRTIIAIVARERRTLRASVQIVDDTGLVVGVRHLEAGINQCSELAAAMALAISIAVDPNRVQNEGVAPVAPRLPTAAAPDENKEQPATLDRIRAEPPRAAEVRQQLSTPSARLSTLRVGAEITSAVGTAPDPAFGVALSTGLRRSAMSVAVEGRYDLPVSAPVAGGGEMQTSMWLGSVVGCAHLGALLGCAVGSVGAMRGQGVDLASPRTGMGFYASAGARVGAEIPLRGRWFFRPRLDVATTLARPELLVDGVTRWVAPRLSMVAGAGLGLQIP